MEWPRVKNILIVLLAIVNVLLFSVYIASTIKDARAMDKTVQNTVSVLSKRGFIIEESQIPRKGNVLYPISCERIAGEEEKIALNFLGKDTVMENGVYKSQNGEAKFKSDGSFEVLLKNPEMKNDKKQLVRKLAECMGISISDDIREVEENGTVLVTAYQTYLGIPVYNCKMNVSVMKDNSIIIRGKAMIGKCDVLRGNPPQDITSILVNLIEILRNNGVNGGKIDDISGGFHIKSAVGAGAKEVTYAFPVWKITVDGKSIYINAMNGKSINIE